MRIRRALTAAAVAATITVPSLVLTNGAHASVNVSSHCPSNASQQIAALQARNAQLETVLGALENAGSGLGGSQAAVTQVEMAIAANTAAINAISSLCGGNNT